MRWLKNNGLTLTLVLLFLRTLGHGLTGWHFENEEHALHGQAGQRLGEHLASGDFLETVFENWEPSFEGPGCGPGSG